MKWFVAIFSFWSALAYGEQAVGNGGHGVKCSGNGSDTYVVLDLFEARAAGLPIDLGPDTASVQEKVDIALDRLERLDFSRAERYRAQARAFLRNSEMLTEIPITNDYGHIELPGSCEIVQIAAQFEPRFPGDLVYAVNEDLWNTIDNDSKAALILHEIAYGESLGYGARSSDEIRKFIGALISTDFAGLDVDDYLLIVRRARLIGASAIFKSLTTSYGGEILSEGRFLYSFGRDGIKRFDPLKQQIKSIYKGDVWSAQLVNGFIYAKTAKGPILKITPDGSAEPTVLPFESAQLFCGHFSIISNTFYIVTCAYKKRSELWAYDLGTFKGVKLAEMSDAPAQIVGSSSNKLLINVSTAHDVNDLYLVNIDGSGLKKLDTFSAISSAEIQDGSVFVLGAMSRDVAGIYEIPENATQARLLVESRGRIAMQAQQGSVYALIGTSLYRIGMKDHVQRYLGELPSTTPIYVIGEHVYGWWIDNGFGKLYDFYKSIY